METSPALRSVLGELCGRARDGTKSSMTNKGGSEFQRYIMQHQAAEGPCTEALYLEWQNILSCIFSSLRPRPK